MTPDIVCPLFDLPDYAPLLAKLREEGIILRNVRSWEHTKLAEFIEPRFGHGWADETMQCFNRHPITAIIAVADQQIVGFAAYEATAPAYFGPTGVDEAFRGRGIGKALLYEALRGLRNLGYVYGFIGSPGPVDFYLKATPGLQLPAEWSNIYTK